MKVGRLFAGAVLGFLFLLFIATDLVLFGVVPVNSVVVTILPAAGLVLGAVLGAVAANRGVPSQGQVQDSTPVEPFAPPTPL